MKLLLFIHLLFFGSPTPDKGPDTLVSCHFNALPFTQFCEDIYHRSGVRIYFRESWVQGLTVTIDADSISVLSATERALNGTGLEVSVWNDNLVVMPGETLPRGLPHFEIQTLQPDSAVKGTRELTRSEERYITGRKADAMQTLRVGKKGLASRGSMVTIRGRITEQQTGEVVIGATMFLRETRAGAATDQNGFVSLVVKPGSYTAIFAFMGLETKKYSLEVLSDGDFSIEMKKSAIQMKEVIVFGDRQMNFRFKDAGLEKISVKTIREIPMMMGERDILKVSEMLPGIVTVGEGSAGLNVRGGNYDQNAFYINKIQIYNTSHLFGFFPAFNADIIKDFSIYKGHIPAQYGGQLSSVFNIIGRQGNRKRFTARGGISPVAANLSVEGPLKKDTSSFLISGRYLYSDWILRQINDPLIRTSNAGFNDFSASWNHDFRKNQVSVFVYHSQDEFRLADVNSYKYSNNGASVNLSHAFSTALRANFSLTGSQYAFNTIDQQEPPLAYKHSYRIGDYRVNADFTHNLSSKNTLQYGAAITWYRLNRGTVMPEGEKSVRLPVKLGLDAGLENAIYLSDSYDVLPWMNISGGLRLTLFNPLGSRTVYTYYPGGPKDPRYIDDTLHFGNGKPVKWYFEPDIRAAVIMRTDANGTVKIAFNQMHQNLFVLNNTIALSPNSQWKLADYHIPPARSNQVSAGIFRTFPQWGWEASIEVYGKRTFNYPEFTDGADFLGTPLVETTVLPGNQDAYGVEFLLRRNGRRLEGWLAYTFSRSVSKVDGDQPWERINNGLAYPANYDIPHVLNTVLMYHFSRRVTASGVVTYQTGRPVTYPVSVYYVNTIPYVDYSNRNEYRIPDYFRLDLSLTIEGNLKRNKLLHSSFIFSLYNVTGRDNPYSVYFKLEKGKIKSYQYSVIGVPVFTVTWLFKLGNYASD
ncbi:MAG: carboxypeptidase-like regulatory domain-containing protein [Bacteroidales bacterium]|nr:carboxypeptidase-like regulatory domain-containing protein [Bacteroidales bacterium]